MRFLEPFCLIDSKEFLLNYSSAPFSGISWMISTGMTYDDIAEFYGYEVIEPQKEDKPYRYKHGKQNVLY